MKVTQYLAFLIMFGSSMILQTVNASLHQEIFASENVVVLFSRPTCPYCHKVMPAWTAVQSEFQGKVRFIYIGNASNVDKGRYNFRTVPSFIYFKNGQRVNIHGSNNGTLTAEQLRNTIQSTFGL